jgi:hydroxyacylglutathione hydrolase
VSAVDRLVPGDLGVRWHAGWPSAKHDPAPEIQVHRYEPATVLLRQNRSVHYEAPFLFLLLGRDRAMLVDTGATADAGHMPLRRTVDALVEGWLAEHPQPSYELLVVHTHGHGDHIAGDAQFTGRSRTTVVGAGLDDVRTWYGFEDWPRTSRQIDLGGRVVDVVPGPGHEEAATVFYDRRTGLLLTGDTLYPGRLYVPDWPAFSATVDRLVAFCDERPVSHVLGCHIEMTSTPGVDYPIRTMHQPDEPPLQLGVEDLHFLRRAVDLVGDTPGVHPFERFVLHHQGAPPAVA